MSLAEVLKVIVPGTVGGFTEWLPISSTGHMILADEVIRLNQPDAFKDVFLVATQLGTTLAVVIMCFHGLNPFGPIETSRQKDITWVLWIRIIIACVPTAILGFLLDNRVEVHPFNAYVVVATLIAYGILFIALENSSACTNPRFNKVGQISAKIAFLIGMVQLLALIPRTSRSGSTILGAIVSSCSKTAVAELSFFLGVPVMLGASLLKIVKYFLAGNTFTGPQTLYTILRVLIVFVVSIYFIRFLMSYVCEHDFKSFGYYRIILGVTVLTYFGITALTN